MALLLRKTYGLSEDDWRLIDIHDILVGNLSAIVPDAYLFLEEDDSAFTVSLAQFLAVIPEDHNGLTVRQSLGYRTGSEFTERSTDILALSEAKHARIEDAFGLNWRVEMSNSQFGEGRYVPIEERTDLLLTNLDGYSDLEGCVVSVNGSLLAVEMVNGRAFALNAHYALLKNESAIDSVMIWDFNQLGGAQFVAFEPGSLKQLPRHSQQPADVERMRYHGNAEFGGKTVFLVLDGIPILQLDRFEFHGRSTATFNVPMRLLVQELFRLPSWYRNRLGDGFMGNGGIMPSGLLLPDLLTRGASGFLIIDSLGIGVRRTPMGRTDMPGEYTLPFPPTGALVRSDYSVSDYLLVGYDGDQASVSITDGRRRPNLNRWTREDQTLYAPLSETTRAPEAIPAEMFNLYSIAP